MKDWKPKWWIFSLVTGIETAYLVVFLNLSKFTPKLHWAISICLALVAFTFGASVTLWRWTPLLDQMSEHAKRCLEGWKRTLDLNARSFNSLADLVSRQSKEEEEEKLN